MQASANKDLKRLDAHDDHGRVFLQFLGLRLRTTALRGACQALRAAIKPRRSKDGGKEDRTYTSAFRVQGLGDNRAAPLKRRQLFRARDACCKGDNCVFRLLRHLSCCPQKQTLKPQVLRSFSPPGKKTRCRGAECKPTQASGSLLVSGQMSSSLSEL